MNEPTAHSPFDTTLILLTVEEAARRLSIGRTTMYALIGTGEVASVPVGRLRRVPVSALHDYTARLLHHPIAA